MTGELDLRGPNNQREPSKGVADELPDDLVAHGYVGPYKFPDNARRRVPGVLYILFGVGAIALAATQSSALVNGGLIVAGIALVVFGGYHIVVGRPLSVGEFDALEIAARQVDFPVGPASAQLSWRGWLSRPTWRVLVISGDPDQTRQLGFVLIDGLDGRILDVIIESEQV